MPRRCNANIKKVYKKRNDIKLQYGMQRLRRFNDEIDKNMLKEMPYRYKSKNITCCLLAKDINACSGKSFRHGAGDAYGEERVRRRDVRERRMRSAINRSKSRQQHRKRSIEQPIGITDEHMHNTSSKKLTDIIPSIPPKTEKDTGGKGK